MGVLVVLPLRANESGGEAPKQEPAPEAVAALKLPGLKINLEEKSVDVDATVCLRTGFLELVACTKDSKEHESILSVDAKPSHIHAALLLLGAKPGNPAMRKPLNEEMTRWVDLPPRGGKVKVSLVFAAEGGEAKEFPISKFISRNSGEVEGIEVDEEEAGQPFPTSTFLFAGSHLYKPKEGKPRYLAEESGNVISIATFGDELLCLPGVHAKDNWALVWEVDPTDLPALDAKVVLRLKPEIN